MEAVDLKRQLRLVLLRHVGRESAIKAEALAELL